MLVLVLVPVLAHHTRRVQQPHFAQMRVHSRKVSVDRLEVLSCSRNHIVRSDNSGVYCALFVDAHAGSNAQLGDVQLSTQGARHGDVTAN